MPVGQDDGLDLIPSVQQVSVIGDDQVDAKHIVFGKHQPSVDDENLPLALDDHHVLAHLAQPAEGNDAQFAAHDGASVCNVSRKE